MTSQMGEDRTTVHQVLSCHLLSVNERVSHQPLLLRKIYSAEDTYIAWKHTNRISLPQRDQERSQTGPKHTQFLPGRG